MQLDYSERYDRHLKLSGFGTEAQQKLIKARVLIIGAGGLGVPVLQYLTGMGIGTLGIVDDDVVNLSNLHRQVLYTTNDIGQPKAIVAATKLQALNDGIEIFPFYEKLSTANALGLVADYDIVVDATDNFNTRYLINDACVILNKTFVYGAVHQYEGHVSVFNFEGGPTYRCLYSKQPAASEVPDCNTVGVLGVVPGIIGCMQALEVVKLITGIGENLSGQLLICNFLNGEQYKMNLKANPANRNISNLQESYETQSCATSCKNISPINLKQWCREERQFILIDVREKCEFNHSHLPEAINIPLGTLNEEMTKLNSDLPIVLYCHKGTRSTIASEIISQRFPLAQLLQLEGGFDNWLKSKEQ